MSTGHTIHLKNFRLDRHGKPIRSTRGRSVSQRIAEQKRPKVKPRGIIMKLTHAIIAAAVFVMAFGEAKATDLLKPSAAPAIPAAEAPAPSGFRSGCYIEGSAGIGIQTASISSEGASVDFSGDGIVAGGGIGCDYKIASGLFIGALGGVDWTNVSVKASDGETAAKITSDPSYYALAKIGFTPAENLMIYALGGASWSTLEALSGSEDFQGWMIGAGADVLLNRHLTIGARYTADMAGSKTADDVKLEPTNHVVRAVMGWRF